MRCKFCSQLSPEGEGIGDLFNLVQCVAFVARSLQSVILLSGPSGRLFLALRSFASPSHSSQAHTTVSLPWNLYGQGNDDALMLRAFRGWLSSSVPGSNQNEHGAVQCFGVRRLPQEIELDSGLHSRVYVWST